MNNPTLRHKIVLVDDNLATLNQGKTLLQPFYKVYTVQTAATLFENLEHDIPDLILLDVEMPETDGFETIKRLKADPRYKDIPVIFLTAKADEENERMGFSLGAVDYIAKPFSGPLLQKRISNQILYMRVKDAVKDYSNDLDMLMDEVAKVKSEGKERLQLMLDSMPFACRLMGRDCLIIDCNQAAMELAGAKDKEEYRAKSLEIIPEFQPCGRLSRELEMEYLSRAFEEGYVRYEWMYKSLDGSDLPVEVTMVRVMLEGEPIIAGYARDLREQKAAIEEMRRAEIAEERDKAKSHFLATMSHEIRTPMNSILGFAELALDAPDETAAHDCKLYLRKIEKSTKLLLHILNDVLDISKIESGKIELEQEPFNLQEVFMSCQSVVLPDIIEKGLEFKINLKPLKGKLLIGDRFRLYQVIMNLLTNAIKFTKEGAVELLCAVKETNAEETTLFFQVKDNGIGITPEQAKIIFDPFTQADSSITRNYGGTGLGLPISKNLIEMMGGTLMLNSTPGVGSSFSFELTFRTMDDVASGKNGKEVEMPEFVGEVLVCEDNVLNQNLISDHLIRVGLQTVIANNGKEGIDIISTRIRNQEKPFDLIFMDIHMPVLDGFKTAPLMKKMGVRTPIIALTANIMSQDLELYRASGMYDVLSKPYTSQELWQCLKRYIPVKALTPVDTKKHNAEAEKMLTTFKADFAMTNRETYAELISAIEAKDRKLAHRIAHTLKSVAGQIHEYNLQVAAAAVENVFTEGTSLPDDAQLKALETELNATLERYGPTLLTE
ncbi:MAG: response regulator [Defluviitaleaceae bacterium]|nr:response regulator [Defluviitaleaceae bacterium]